MPVEDVLEAVPELRDAREVESLAGGLTNTNYKVTTPGRPLRRSHLRQGHRPARDRSHQRGAQHDRRCRDRRRRAGRRCPAAARRDRLRVPRRRGDGCGETADAATGSSRSRSACRRLHGGRRFLQDFDMFDIQRGYVRVVQEHGFRLPDRYAEFEPAVRELERAMRVRERADRPVQQRPARGELHRGRRRHAADRLRVLGEQRACLRAREHLERVQPVARPARGARRRTTTAGRCATRSPVPASGA